MNSRIFMVRSVFRIRILIRFGFNPDSIGSVDPEFWIRNQKGENAPKKRRNCIFEELDALFGLEGSPAWKKTRVEIRIRNIDLFMNLSSYHLKFFRRPCTIFFALIFWVPSCRRFILILKLRLPLFWAPVERKKRKQLSKNSCIYCYYHCNSDTEAFLSDVLFCVYFCWFYFTIFLLPSISWW